VFELQSSSPIYRDLRRVVSKYRYQQELRIQKVKLRDFAASNESGRGRYYDLTGLSTTATNDPKGTTLNDGCKLESSLVIKSPKSGKVEFVSIEASPSTIAISPSLWN
jgi:hypothetical protein